MKTSCLSSILLRKGARSHEPATMVHAAEANQYEYPPAIPRDVTSVSGTPGPLSDPTWNGQPIWRDGNHVDKALHRAIRKELPAETSPVSSGK